MNTAYFLQHNCASVCVCVVFKCYKDHECSYMYVHAAMVGRVMLCGVGSMFLVDSSLVQLFVSSSFSVLTTYVYSCHTSLTVMPLSVFV